MIRYFVLLVVVAFFLIVGPLWADKQGLLHIEFCDYIIETSLVTAGVVVIMVWFLGALLYALFQKILGLKTTTEQWFYKKSKQQAFTQFEHSLVAYIEGDYKKSFSLAQKCAKHDLTNVSSALLMAASGLELNNSQACEALLEVAKQRKDEAVEHILNYLRLKEYLKHERYEAAYALASVFYAKSSLDTRIVEAMIFCAVKLNKIDEVISLCTNALRQKIFSASEILELSGKYFVKTIGETADKQAVENLWSKLPSVLKSQVMIINALASKLNALHEDNAVAKIIKHAIKQEKNLDDVYKGIAFWTRGNEEILRYLERINSKEQMYTWYHVAVANLLLLKGDLNRARDLYEKIVITSDNARAIYNLANIYEAQCNFKDATLLFKKLISYK